MLIHSECRFAAAPEAVDEGGADVWLVQSLSRSEVTVESANPRHLPSLKLDLLSEESDLVHLRDGLKRFLAIAAQPSINQIAGRSSVRHRRRRPLDTGRGG